MSISGCTVLVNVETATATYRTALQAVLTGCAQPVNAQAAAA
jgi:hypothetical protein